MTGRKIRIPGFRLDRHGKPVRDERHLDVSARLRRKAGKKVRVVRKVPRMSATIVPVERLEQRRRERETERRRREVFDDLEPTRLVTLAGWREWCAPVGEAVRVEGMGPNLRPAPPALDGRTLI